MKENNINVMEIEGVMISSKVVTGNYDGNNYSYLKTCVAINGVAGTVKLYDYADNVVKIEPFTRVKLHIVPYERNGDIIFRCVDVSAIN